VKKCKKVICWRSGLVELADFAPEGAIELGEVRTKAQRDKLDVICRHARTGDDRFIPGVPEADDDDAAMDAVIEFMQQMKKRKIPTGFIPAAA
jgi:hypothetical protein